MDLSRLSVEVVDLLEKQQAKIVLAESCTAGLIAASLGQVPGVSQYLCGSMVVYREQSKISWLDVDPSIIEESTAVSDAATRAIAKGVLEKTDEAAVSLGITGHLGPGSPAELDGQIFVACYKRNGQTIEELNSIQHRLESTSSRSDRQKEAASIALSQLKRSLADQ